jgi:uncharacterized protein
MLFTLKIFIGIISLLVILWLSLSYLLLLSSNSLIFHPSHNSPNPSFQVDVVNDYQIWSLENQKNPEKVILYFHGNAGFSNEQLEGLATKYTTFGINYAGFNGSNGSPTPQNVLESSIALYDFVISKGYTPEQIIVWGHSLGGSPATYLASQKPINQLVIVNSFTSIKAMCQKDYGVLCILADVHGKIFPTKDFAQSVKSPVKIFASKQDEVIPFEMEKELYTYFQSPKELIILDGNHNNFDVAKTIEEL